MPSANIRMDKRLVNAWLNLRAVAPLRSIRNERDYRAMVRLADSLIDAGAGSEDHPLADLLAVVGDLIARWEASNVDLPDALPSESLRLLMAEHGLKQTDLSDLVSQGVLSQILAGKRGVSKKLAHRLAERFAVPITVFV